jgi:hypothetical protein
MQDEKGCDYPKPQQTQPMTYLGLLFGIVVVSVIAIKEGWDRVTTLVSSNHTTT